ncbi:MAG: universal stress protein [Casimicrobiaceae bacterium]
MFKSILVAVDGGATSWLGFRHALALAREQEATLHVLHILDDAPLITGYEGAGYITQDYVDRLDETLRRNANKVLAKAAAEASAAGHAVNRVLVEARGNGVAGIIVREARKLRADLIVLGTHGRSGLKRLVMGSDAEAVVRETKLPVLLVRAGPGRASRAKPAAMPGGQMGEGAKRTTKAAKRTTKTAKPATKTAKQTSRSAPTARKRKG